MICQRIACTLAIGFFSVATAKAADAQQLEQSSADSVGRILQVAPAPAAGYMRYNFPRRDIVLKVGDVTVSPALALGAWVGFAGTRATATVMGDLVLLGDELRATLEELNKQGIAVTAIHNHIVGDPQVDYVHFHAEGDLFTLAAKMDKVLGRTRTPRPVVAAPPAAPTLDTALVFRTIGIPGRAAGAVAQFTVVLPTGAVTMHGKTVVPAMAYGTPINVQMVSATRYVATGDYSVLEGRVQPVLDALAANGIAATAVHTHLVGELPKVYYIHFWADGTPQAVLTGLRAAMDAGR